MPIPSKLKQKISAGLPATGFWVNIADPTVAQIAAVAGYDWVMLDLEHNPISEAQAGWAIASLAPGTPVVARVRGNREEHVKWVLDAGAAGVIIPGIDSLDDARKAVEYAKYHPIGKRGFGPNRASDFWISSKQYVTSANQDILMICQIELKGAVDAIDEICSLEGVDGVWIGPGDLSQSLGHLGDAGHSEVVAAIDHVIDAANGNRMPWGIPTAAPADYLGYVSRGGVLMTLGSDTRLLLNGAKELLSSVVPQANS